MVPDLSPLTEPLTDQPDQQLISETPAAESDLSAMSRCFTSTFVTIFLAELGDKTQVATLLLSAQSHNPWVVFAGSALALISTSLVGVLLGQWLSKLLTPRRLELATGTILLIVSVLLFVDVAGMG
ncbi:MAG: TMEM165/GDT1 family protein [Cyanobacteria bacterium]|nr:TMEM165/GDT1 family protein [Cyanobacteriota bacterium]